jgi:hypothetical protein
VKADTSSWWRPMSCRIRTATVESMSSSVEAEPLDLAVRERSCRHRCPHALEPSSPPASSWSWLPSSRRCCAEESASWLSCSTTWPMQRCSSRRRPHVCYRRGSRGRSSGVVLLPLLWRRRLLQPETVATDGLLLLKSSNTKTGKKR